MRDGRTAMAGGLRHLWAHTGWARLGRIGAALERIEDALRAQSGAQSALASAIASAAALSAAAGERSDAQPTNGTESPVDLAIYERMGLRLLLDPYGEIERHIIAHGEWEPEQIMRLKVLATEGASRYQTRIFLDIGAYFGLYALLFDRERLFDRIIAYEPDRMTFSELQAQLYVNGAAYRIEARNAAVGARAGSVRHLRADLHPRRNRGGVGEFAVPDALKASTPVVAIDDELDVEGAFVVAKIDVEGAQEAVLQGMRRTVTRNGCVVQVEAFEAKRAATLALLAELKLEVVAAVGPDVFATNVPLRATERRVVDWMRRAERDPDAVN